MRGGGPGCSRGLRREEAAEARAPIPSGSAEPKAVGALPVPMRRRGETRRLAAPLRGPHHDGFARAIVTGTAAAALMSAGAAAKLPDAEARDRALAS